MVVKSKWICGQCGNELWLQGNVGVYEHGEMIARQCSWHCHNCNLSVWNTLKPKEWMEFLDQEYEAWERGKTNRQ